VMAGVDLWTVQELIGHKTVAMTVRYSHLAPSQRRRLNGLCQQKLLRLGQDQLTQELTLAILGQL
jgi:site-specific recombinase XerD